MRVIFFLFVVVLLGGCMSKVVSDLPYGKLQPDSPECKKIEDSKICEASGCIWENGDLTGPEFCGAYKE